MPIDITHPLVRARYRAGIGQAELARRTGLHRSTISAIEEGRSRAITVEAGIVIDQALGRAVGTTIAEVSAYAGNLPPFKPTLEQRMILNMTPEQLAFRFRLTGFAGWRAVFARSATSFASEIGVNRAVVASYEKGGRKRGMSQALVHAIAERFGVDLEYVLAVAELDVR